MGANKKLNEREGSFLILKRTEKIEIAEEPTYGKCFKVDVREILKNERLFEEERVDQNQESTRLMIKTAIQKVKKNPLNYESVFYLLIPEKEWVYKERPSERELKLYATRMGGYISNCTTEPLAWAQWIINKKNWITVCNKPDKIEYFRVVEWEKPGNLIMIGGSRHLECKLPASDIENHVAISGYMLNYVVPSVIIPEKS